MTPHGRSELRCAAKPSVHVLPRPATPFARVMRMVPSSGSAPAFVSREDGMRKTRPGQVPGGQDSSVVDGLDAGARTKASDQSR